MDKLSFFPDLLKQVNHAFRAELPDKPVGLADHLAFDDLDNSSEVLKHFLQLELEPGSDDHVNALQQFDFKNIQLFDKLL